MSDATFAKPGDAVSEANVIDGFEVDNDELTPQEIRVSRLADLLLTAWTLGMEEAQELEV
jgi:hypothetical protein